jgi:3-phenylpropionate/trans-cinnamate dioxygenase ferredoxin subunit
VKAYPVAHTSEFGPGKRRTIVAAGREILIINVGGTYYAVRNRCSHQGGPIGEGPVTRAVFACLESGWDPQVGADQRVLRCPWHGMEYDLSTGAAIGNPTRRIRMYATCVNDEGVVEVLR